MLQRCCGTGSPAGLRSCTSSQQSRAWTCSCSSTGWHPTPSSQPHHECVPADIVAALHCAPHNPQAALRGCSLNHKTQALRMPRADLGARPYIGSAMITVAERRKPTVYLRPGLQQLSTRCRTPDMGPDGRSLSRVVRTHCGAAPASRELLYTGSIKTSFLKSGPQQRYCNFGALCRKYALILHCPLCHRLALAQSDLMRVARPSLDSPCPLGFFLTPSLLPQTCSSLLLCDMP